MSYELGCFVLFGKGNNYELRKEIPAFAGMTHQLEIYHYQIKIKSLTLPDTNNNSPTCLQSRYCPTGAFGIPNFNPSWVSLFSRLDIGGEGVLFQFIKSIQKIFPFAEVI